jgi:phage terminase Nu1 subunit (DNA packaging protein)
VDLNVRILQKDFAELVGVSESTVSEWVTEGVLARGASGREWLLAYCARLREQAAGRASTGPLDLSQERAGLARAQREGQEMKNAITRGEYAPIGLLADVLAIASAGVGDRMDAFPGQLRKLCPGLPPVAIEAIKRCMASARNDWIKSTSDLVVQRIDELSGIDADPSADDIGSDLEAGSESTSGEAR